MLWSSILAVCCLLLATVQAVQAQDDDVSCFVGNYETGYPVELQTGSTVYYQLGFGEHFVSIGSVFLADGRFCAHSNYPDTIRITGSNEAAGKLEVSVQVTIARKDDDDAPVFENDKPVIVSQDTYKGTLDKTLTDNLVIWSGVVSGADGTPRDIYLKRSRKIAPDQEPPAEAAFNCGDGGCSGSEFAVLVKPQDSSTLERLARTLPLMAFRRVNKDDVEYQDSCVSAAHSVDLPMTEKGVSLSPFVCFAGETQPLHEWDVIRELYASKIVVGVRRAVGGAGVDTESIFIQPGDLVAGTQLRANRLADLIDPQLRAFIGGSGVAISDPGARGNWLFWDIKGPRAAIERIASPTPHEKAEWWKMRLQVSIANADPGSYFFNIGMPESKSTIWGGDAPPDDAKFVAEVLNEPKFVSFQSRVIVAITKFLDVHTESP